MQTATLNPTQTAARPVLANASEHEAAAARALKTAGFKEPENSEMWALARARCQPEALTAAWQYGRAIAGDAGDWDVARARIDAVYALRDAWEARTPTEEDDVRTYPAGLREEVRMAESALLSARAPNWHGVADKVRFLLGYIDGDVWASDWTPEPQAKGMAGALGRLMICAEQIGEGEPSADDVLMAALAAEDLAHTAAHDAGGYQNYAINPDAVGWMAATVGSILRDSRALSRRRDGAGAWAIQAVWFPDDMTTAGAA